MATCDDFSDVETDDISVPYFVNFGETVATSSNESKCNDLHHMVISGKRKLESDSSSDSDETESISTSVENFKHLSVDEEIVIQTKTNNQGAVPDASDATTWFSEEDEICANEDGDSVLHILTLFQETYQLLRWLCSCCDSKVKDLINKKNKLGQTALHIAALVKDWEITESLLYVGADPGVQDARGRTILHILAGNGGGEMLKTLYDIFELKNLTLEYSGGFCKFTDIPNYDGLSALHLATMNKDKNMVALLLSLGASPATGDRRSGRTALHFAAEAGNMDLVQVISANTEKDIDARTYNRETALILAYHRGHNGIVEFLKARGAEYDTGSIKLYGPVKRKSQRRATS